MAVGRAPAALARGEVAPHTATDVARRADVEGPALAVGEGARRYVTGQFSSLGTDLLIVLPGRAETAGGRLECSVAKRAGRGLEGEGQLRVPLRGAIEERQGLAPLARRHELRGGQDVVAKQCGDLVAGLFCLLEWLRGHVLTGFPWNLPGYAWSEVPSVMQVTAYGGIYALTALTLCSLAPRSAMACGRRPRAPADVASNVVTGGRPDVTGRRAHLEEQLDEDVESAARKADEDRGGG